LVQTLEACWLLRLPTDLLLCISAAQTLPPWESSPAKKTTLTTKKQENLSMIIMNPTQNDTPYTFLQ
jgi:hypothetical protein